MKITKLDLAQFCWSCKISSFCTFLLLKINLEVVVSGSWMSFPNSLYRLGPYIRPFVEVNDSCYLDYNEIIEVESKLFTVR